ncbi:unnamed protein product [Mucor circinelloides]
MLDKLPTDILYNILNLLDNASLINLSLVSKYFNCITNDELIWKKLCAQEFNISQDNAFRNKGWKKFYQGLKYHAKVFTWGENFDDRLGLGDKSPAIVAETGFMPANPRLRMPRFTARYPNQVTVPQEVASLKDKHIIDITSGGWSIHALQTTGSVYMWGTMQQDISPRSSVGTRRLRLPTLLQDTNETQQKVQFHSISSGRGHVIGLARDGSVWHWSNHIMLQRVDLSIDDKVVQVAANWNYSSVLTSTGNIYIIPKPDLIIPSQVTTEPQPTQIVSSGISTMQLLPQHTDKIIQIAGLDGFTLALTEFGRILKIATLDQDALNNRPMQCVVELTHFSSTENEHNSRQGAMHRFLTGAFNNFAVYTKEKVMLGTVDVTSDTEPTRLAELDNHDVCKVSFGDYHYGALTSQGKLLTWGSYSSGALGHGNISQENHPIPKYVESLADKFVFAIGFGGWQSAVLAIDRVDDENDSR